MSKEFGNISGDHATAVRRVIRVSKEDSAYVYAILESHEGIASYSTLDHRVGEPHRDLELLIPVSRLAEAERVLNELKELIYEPKDSST